MQRGQEREREREPRRGEAASAVTSQLGRRSERRRGADEPDAANACRLLRPAHRRGAAMEGAPLSPRSRTARMSPHVDVARALPTSRRRARQTQRPRRQSPQTCTRTSPCLMRQQCPQDMAPWNAPPSLLPPPPLEYDREECARHRRRPARRPSTGRPGPRRLRGRRSAPAGCAHEAAPAPALGPSPLLGAGPPQLRTAPPPRRWHAPPGVRPPQLCMAPPPQRWHAPLGVGWEAARSGAPRSPGIASP
mmetsp:Transcript_42288/g.117743  ORF Transcript_42288/g.117743 Transcript_42288/m.117743 type:complete len:249 (-) Transcript_42288:482-1228(-)